MVTPSPTTARLRRWAPGCAVAFVLMTVEAIVMAIWILDARGH